jgi:hypothetical protein
MLGVGRPAFEFRTPTIEVLTIDRRFSWSGGARSSLAGQALDEAPEASAPRLYVEMLNESFDAQTTRVYGLTNRVPTAVLVLEVVLAAIALAALSLHLATLGRGVLTVLIAAALVILLLQVTFDLDRPTRGLITVPATPLVDTRAAMALPPAAGVPSGSRHGGHEARAGHLPAPPRAFGTAASWRAVDHFSSISTSISSPSTSTSASHRTLSGTSSLTVLPARLSVTGPSALIAFATSANQRATSWRVIVVLFSTLTSDMTHSVPGSCDDNGFGVRVHPGHTPVSAVIRPDRIASSSDW